MSAIVSPQGLRVGGALTLSQARKVNVEQGCNVLDPCSSNPCPANSYCSSDWDRFSCTCLSGQCARMFPNSLYFPGPAWLILISFISAQVTMGPTAPMRAH